MDSKKESPSVTHSASVTGCGLASKTHSMSPQRVYELHVITLLVYIGLSIFILSAIYSKHFRRAEWAATALLVISTLALVPVLRSGSFGYA